ncbi:MAG: kynureninase [Pacificimonas sp.]|nr:kynureninase [Pacificimonas sp.]
MILSAADTEQLDRDDPLASFRDRFRLRPGLLYFDGNSLGVMPHAARDRVIQTLDEEWSEGLITSWLSAGWQAAPRRIGDKLAKLVGAEAGEVIAADSTSVNLFKALGAAASLRPERCEILSESTNFPTDVYMMQGLETVSAGRLSAVTVHPNQVLSRVNENTAAVLLTQVHYKTGLVRDMIAATRSIQEKGALAIWDLSHSTGAIEVDLNAANADFAVGCGYKFLNGGPGAPAYFYAAKRNQGAAPILSGWFGHARPFAFEEDYEASPEIDRFQCGTPQILGLAGLEAGVDLILEADMRQVRHKSRRLGEILIERMKPLADRFGFELASPADSADRGSQVSYAHPEAYAIIQALKELDVIGDFRAPDIMRLGLTPLYQRYQDIVEFVHRLEKVCEDRIWDKAEYRTMASVT